MSDGGNGAVSAAMELAASTTTATANGDANSSGMADGAGAVAVPVTAGGDGDGGGVTQSGVASLDPASVIVRVDPAPVTPGAESEASAVSAPTTAPAPAVAAVAAVAVATSHPPGGSSALAQRSASSRSSKTTLTAQPTMRANDRKSAAAASTTTTTTTTATASATKRAGSSGGGGSDFSGAALLSRVTEPIAAMSRSLTAEQRAFAIGFLVSVCLFSLTLPLLTSRIYEPPCVDKPVHEYRVVSNPTRTSDTTGGSSTGGGFGGNQSTEYSDALGSAFKRDSYNYEDDDSGNAIGAAALGREFGVGKVGNNGNVVVGGGNGDRVQFSDYKYLMREYNHDFEHPQVRTAFILLTHDETSLAGAKELMAAIYHPDHFYYVHVDRKADQRAVHSFVRSLAGVESAVPRNIVLEQRYDGHWGGMSLVQMVMNGISRLLAFPHWEKVVLLSGDTYVLRTLQQIDNRMVRLRGKSLFHYSAQQKPLPYKKIQQTKRARVDHIWFESARMEVTDYRPSMTIADYVARPGAEVWYATQWFVLERDFARYSVKSHLAKDVSVFFATTKVPDASYFITMLKNSPFRHTLTDAGKQVSQYFFMRWDKCPAGYYAANLGASHPCFVNHAYMKGLSGTSAMFVRKIHARKDPDMYAAIDELIVENAHKRM